MEVGGLGLTSVCKCVWLIFSPLRHDESHQCIMAVNHDGSQWTAAVFDGMQPPLDMQGSAHSSCLALEQHLRCYDKERVNLSCIVREYLNIFEVLFFFQIF